MSHSEFGSFGVLEVLGAQDSCLLSVASNPALVNTVIVNNKNILLLVLIQLHRWTTLDQKIKKLI